MNLRTIYICTLIGLLFGCDESLERPDTNQFVVEAFITAEAPINDITIKETVSLDVDEFENIPITDAQIRLISDNESVVLDYNVNTGKYFAPNNDISIVNFEDYEVEITVNGITATSSTVVPEAPTDLTLSDSTIVIPSLTLNFGLRQQVQDLFNNERLTLNWKSNQGRSYFVVIENKEDEIDPILPDDAPQESVNLLQSFRFISEPSEQTSFEIIGVALETYGVHVAKVYSVNQEYIDLFNSDTQDSRDLNEPPSNIINALGIFTAFAVDSIEFEVVRP